MANTNRERLALSNKLYQQYGKPLEKEHKEEFLAISPTGKVLLAPSLLEAMEQASSALGPGNFIYKVGEKVVGKWR